MFESFNAGTLGNNLYLDNININGVPGDNLPIANFSSTNTTICAGQTVQFTDQSQPNVTSRNWTFPGGTPSTSTSANPIITYNNSGTYNVTLAVTNANGTTSVTQNNHVVVNPTPSVPVITQNGNVLSVFLQMGETATWFLDGTQVGTGQNLTINNSGNYTVEVSNTFGCRSTSTVFNVLSTEENWLSNQILIYPNPSTGIFNILLGDVNASNLMVIDAVGRLIRTIDIQNNDVTMNLSELHSGLYSLVIRTENGIIIRKIEIMK
jgi:PKD repeat protein